MKNISAFPLSVLLSSLSLAALSLAFSAEQSHAVVLVNYPFSGTLAPVPASNVSATNISFGSGASGIANLGSLTLNTTADNAIVAFSNNSYLEFTVSPTPGNFRLNLSSLNFLATVNTPSPLNGYFIRSSSDTFASDLATGTFTGASGVNNISVPLSSSSFQDVGIPLAFRVYSFQGSGSGAVAGIGNFQLSGTATAVPFESDSLPVVGATLFMAGGLWWKRKRNQDKVAQLIEK